VEEIPLQRPAGHGEHVLFQVEKRNLSTFDALLRLSKALKVSEHAIGYGGLKDARAVTSQYFTAHRIPVERVRRLRHPAMRVLSAAPHDRPMKIGHLRGNRFTIRVRDVDPARVEAARRALETLVQRGLPNAYGDQRFGLRRDGHRIGRALANEDWPEFLRQLLGRPSPLEGNPDIRAAREAYDAGDLETAYRRFPLRHRAEKKVLSALRRGESPRDAFLTLGHRARKIWVAAWQSHLFNRVLAARIEAGTYDRLLVGDLAWLTEEHATYRVTDEATEAPRARALLASPTGPLVGIDLPRAAGLPGRLETDVLREEGADPEAFRAEHAFARGQRRPLRVPVEEASLDLEDERTAVVRFVLPPGSFATVLLDQLMRGPVPVRG
jgi:tRNA pseudouridine13 synthase